MPTVRDPAPTPDDAATGTLALTLASPAATDALGARLARLLGPGDAVMLSGPLGAGKSALARAVVRARLADPHAEVPSPSYTLVNVYGAPDGVEIWHADLYRLGAAEEAGELGLADAFDAALALVEWPERLDGALPPRRLEIALALLGDTVRGLRLRAVGPDWDRLVSELGALAEHRG